MKIISEEEYTSLRANGEKCIGRIIPSADTTEVVYYKVDGNQKNLCPTEILDGLFLTDHKIVGKEFDVIRHWTTPEIIHVRYKLS